MSAREGGERERDNGILKTTITHIRERERPREGGGEEEREIANNADRTIIRERAR